MLFSSVHIAILGLAFCTRALEVRDGSNYFINPPTNGYLDDFKNSPAYEAGNVLDIKWTADFHTSSLTLWQEGVYGSSLSIFPATESRTRTSYNWTVDVSSFDIAGVNSTTGVPKNIFYLYLYQPSDPTGGFSSIYFNVTQPRGAAAAASPTTTYLSAPATYVSVGALPTGASNPVAFAGADYAGDNTNYRLIYGLALGLGIPAVIGLSILACCLMRRFSKPVGRNAAPSRVPVPVGPMPAAVYYGGPPIRAKGQDAVGASAAREHFAPGAGSGPALREHYSPDQTGQAASYVDVPLRDMSTPGAGAQRRQGGQSRLMVNGPTAHTYS